MEAHKKLYQLDMEKNTRKSQIRMLRERVTELERTIDPMRHGKRESSARSPKWTAEGRARSRPGLRSWARAYRGDGGEYRGFIADIEGFAAKVRANEAEDPRQWGKDPGPRVRPSKSCASRCAPSPRTSSPSSTRG